MGQRPGSKVSKYSRLLHPAVNSANARPKDSTVKVDTMEGWNVFSLKQKKFLALLPLYRHYSDASVAIGEEERWSEFQRRHHPLFDRACRIQMSSPPIIVASFVQEMWLAAMVRLLDFVNSDNPAHAMQAIRMLSQLAGETEGAHPRAPKAPAEPGSLEGSSIIQIKMGDVNLEKPRPDVNMVAHFKKVKAEAKEEKEATDLQVLTEAEAIDVESKEITDG